MFPFKGIHKKYSLIIIVNSEKGEEKKLKMR